LKKNPYDLRIRAREDVEFHHDEGAQGKLKNFLRER